MGRKLTDEEKRRYYLYRLSLRRRALELARRKKAVLYGSHGLNLHLPNWLRLPASDYDAFHQKPKKTARYVEKELDKDLGFDGFRVVKALHPKTWRVFSNTTDRELIDFTKPERKIKHDLIGGQRVARLNELKRLAKKSLRNPKSKFRHKKDREHLQRIRILKKSKW